jgi:ParB family chromosome partitioning protein
LGSIASIKIKNIETNPFQPRTNFEEIALQELADSIAQHGIIQPITVRKLGYDQYQLISGERRFRAAQIAEFIRDSCIHKSSQRSSYVGNGLDRKYST